MDIVYKDGIARYQLDGINYASLILGDCYYCGKPATFGYRKKLGDDYLEFFFCPECFFK